MKIRMLVNHFTDRGRYGVNHVYDVPDETGEYWLDKGIAELVGVPDLPAIPDDIDDDDEED